MSFGASRRYATNNSTGICSWAIAGDRIVECAALPGAAVALETSVGEIDPLPVGGIAGRCILRQRRRANPSAANAAATNATCGETSEPRCELSHGHLLSAESLTTSTSAG